MIIFDNFTPFILHTTEPANQGQKTKLCKKLDLQDTAHLTQPAKYQQSVILLYSMTVWNLEYEYVVF